MVLNIFDSIRKFVEKIFSKFDLANFSILFFGIVIGFVLAMAIYVAIVLSTIKKSSRISPIELDEIDNIQVQRVIESAKDEYFEIHRNAPAGEKILVVRDLSWQIIKDIARIYYPDSDYPVYELSVDELLTLNHYITNRIDEMFAGAFLKSFKNVKISQILTLLDLKKKLDENKAVKLANKTKAPQIFSKVARTLNFLNPVYWVRKVMLTSTLDAITNKMADTIFTVVGDETNKIYSKNQDVFTTGNDISEQIKELERLLEYSENNDY